MIFLIALFLWSIVTSAGAESSLTHGVVGRDPAVMPVTRQSEGTVPAFWGQSPPGVRQNFTLGSQRVVSPEDLTYRDYILGTGTGEGEKGIFPTLLEFQQLLKNRYDNYSGIEDLRGLVDEKVGEVHQLIQSDISWEEKYRQIKADAAAVAEQLKEIGRIGSMVSRALQRFHWPE